MNPIAAIDDLGSVHEISDWQIVVMMIRGCASPVISMVSVKNENEIYMLHPCVFVQPDDDHDYTTMLEVLCAFGEEYQPLSIEAATKLEMGNIISSNIPAKDLAFSYRVWVKETTERHNEYQESIENSILQTPVIGIPKYSAIKFNNEHLIEQYVQSEIDGDISQKEIPTSSSQTIH